MIRLVFVSALAYNYFFPGKASQAGGHTRIINLAKAFAKLPGYKIFCITGDFGQPHRVEKDGVTLVKAPIDNPVAFIPVMSVIRTLNPDLLIDFCASPRLFLYYLLKKSMGLKYIFLTGSDVDVNGDYRRIENLFYDYFYMKGLKNADSVIAQVPCHQQRLSKNWNIKSHVILSPYFDIQRPDTGSMHTILWVGRAAYYKRPELFLTLARKFPKHKFVMICNPSSYDNGFMKTLTDQTSDLKNFEFLDYVPYSQMEKFYKQARFLVNTSDFEGFANTFIEAAIHQVPILSLNSDPNQMLSVHGGGIACGGDFNRMKKKCRIMLEDCHAVKKAGIKAFDYALRYHQIDRAVERMAHIFGSILKQ